MLKKLFRSIIPTGALACLSLVPSLANDIVPQPLEVVVSVPEQRMVVLRDGGVIAKYPISTSKFGLGDSFGSYKTPLGHLKVCDKVGSDLASGTVIKHRSATKEILPVNAAGRDPIVTRILWLDGEDDQNRNARARGIYIHGTTEEKRIGQPVSYGCIRMRSRDIIQVFEQVPVGTPINIIAQKLPKLRKYSPTPPVIMARNAPAATEKKAAAPTRLAANSQLGETKYLSEIASGAGSIAGDPGAADALKGSILSAGLPDASRKTGSQKQDSMTFHSWSALSLRDVESSGVR